MDINRKLEAIHRLYWLVDNEMSQLPEKEESIDIDQSWVDEYNQEMTDAFELVKKMLDDAKVERDTQAVAKQARIDHPHLSYDQSISIARRHVKEFYKKEVA